VGNAVEVCLQISIQHMGVTGLQKLVNFPQGILASSVRFGLNP
jgi:hypothetical protein